VPGLQRSKTGSADILACPDSKLSDLSDSGSAMAPGSVEDGYVYVVDDDASVRRAVSRLMRAWGMKVKTFSSAEQFINADVDDRRACVIADVLMTGGSGFELPELLSSRGRNIPVILMTAHDSDVARDKATQVGAAGYFRKPLDDQALIDSIRWVLSKGRSKKQ